MKTTTFKTALLLKSLAFSLLFIFYASFCFAQGMALYGMTYWGGTGQGDIFKYNLTTNAFTDLVDFTGTTGAYLGANPTGSIIVASDGNLYGMTGTSGVNSKGNIFKYNPATSTFTDLVDFTGDTGAYLGSEPRGSLIQVSDGNLYGITVTGGTHGGGTIFKYNPTTNAFTDLIDFTGDTGSYIGLNPYSSLILASDGSLYGMTLNGGTNGTVFKYNPTTNVFTNLVDFTGTGGSYPGWNPNGSLTQASDGNLYGMTMIGGTNEAGNIFKYNPITNTYTDLVDFLNPGYIGNAPRGSLIQASDGNLYGMTSAGGPDLDGNIFKYNPTTNAFTDLVDFTGNTGSYIGDGPEADLIQASDGNLYGMTYNGGTHRNGNIFKYDPTTSVFTDMVEFTNLTGSYLGQWPQGNLVEDTSYTTGINNISTPPLSINIYPDPTAGHFTISGLTQGQTVEIYNYTGQRIESRIADNTRMDCNIAAYASGMYLIRVQNQDGSVAAQKKMVKIQ